MGSMLLLAALHYYSMPQTGTNHKKTNTLTRSAINDLKQIISFNKAILLTFFNSSPFLSLPTEYNLCHPHRCFQQFSCQTGSSIHQLYISRSLISLMYLTVFLPILSLVSFFYQHIELISVAYYCKIMVFMSGLLAQTRV